MLKLLAAPLAGAVALLVCALALGIDPLVSAIVGALVWAGVQLVWGASGGSRAAGTGLSFTPGQKHQIETAVARIARIDVLAAAVDEPRLAQGLDRIARRAEALVEQLRGDPAQFDLFRKALGNYLVLAEELAARLAGAERPGRFDPAMADRGARTLDRLADLFAALGDRAAAFDRIDLDARIAVLEAEIDADAAKQPDRSDFPA